MMTPRQIDRAVNAALGRILPPMLQQLRDDLVAELRQHLPARDAAPTPAEQAELVAKLVEAAERCEVVVPGAAPMAATPAPAEAAVAPSFAEMFEAAERCEGVVPEAAPQEPAPDPAWFRGAGHGRRLTEEGFAQLRAMLDRKLPVKQIARILGMSPSSASRQMKILASAAKALSTADQSGVNPEEAQPAPEVLGVDLAAGPDVQVVAPVPVPAAPEAPALILPPPPPAIVMPAPAAPARLILPAAPPPPPRPKSTPQVITTTHKDVRVWLIASMKAGGLTLVQAEDRVGFMTHDQALAEANLRRARAGHPPFAFIGAQRRESSAA